jgi:ribonuclease G
MGKELVISSNRHQTKVAVLEDDQLVEIYFQRSNEYSLAGSIHKGRVTRVLPGMQSAFVDIRLDRDAFLYVSDFFEEHEEYDRIATPAEQPGRRQEPVESPSSSASAAAPAASEQAPAAGEPGAESEGRDRRGRRSRRRRSRGRGFPESKYAAPAAATEPVAVTEEPEASPEFLLLPGESLAKYTRDEGAGELADEPEAGTLEVAAASEEEGAAGEVAPESAVAVPTPADESEEEIAAAEIEADVEADLAQQIAEAAEEAGAAAFGAPAGAGEAAADVEAAVEPAAEESAEPEAEVEPKAETESAAGEIHDGEAQEADAEPLEQTEPSGELRADVRETSTRYPHRLSRRMRRKMRNTSGSDTRESGAEARDNGSRREAPAEVAPVAGKSTPSITDLLKEGQEILVQIAKEPLGQKGARITSHIALPGRFVVYMPTVDHLGVSRKIASDEERHRLRRILQTHCTGIPGGYIVRTAGEGQSEKDIAADMMFLYNLWLDIRKKAERKPAPVLAHHDLDVVQRLLRDQLAEDFKAVWCDNEETYESILRFVERIQPRMVSQVKMYTRTAPVFDAFNITAELEKALRPKVWLKSGGYIVVNQTEALVAIDVNTGKFVGKSNRLEDTIVKTNTEAIREIVRQVRLRDLGGIIVVDFIDMDERKNRQKVMQTLEDEMRRDRAPYKILQFNDFGLVAITRKRVKQSLERTLCSPCPACEGAGYVKSVQTVVGEILQEAVKIAPAIEGPDVVLRVHPEVAKVLKSTKNDYLEELEEILRYPVLVTGDPLLHPEKWDMA